MKVFITTKLALKEMLKKLPSGEKEKKNRNRNKNKKQPRMTQQIKRKKEKDSYATYKIPTSDQSIQNKNEMMKKNSMTMKVENICGSNTCITQKRL